ncbi:MAG TPA: rhodanese-like domain-containing protein [Steroidobacteraceae bacterium]|nr:rhodanese-like domain-containing protein [Steroidobacteraceae bacterium]
MGTTQDITEIAPAALKRLLDSAAPPLVLDVREPWELEAARLTGTLDIPMMHIPQRLAELPRDRPIVVMCHGGVRSMKVAHFLAQNGFNQVANLVGGIHAWACDVDPSIGTY